MGPGGREFESLRPDHSSFTQAKHNAQSGFGVGLIGALLAILAFTAAMLELADSNALDELDNHHNTLSQMEEIKLAVIRYRSIYGSYPCPASLTEPPTSAAYGTPAVCDDNTTDQAIATDGINDVASTFSSARRITIGAVPFKALNLAPDMMLDRWKNRIVFAVVDSDTYTPPLNLDDPDADEKLIDIWNAVGGGTDITDAAFGADTNIRFALVSMGENGNGAYSRIGNTVGVCNASAPEGENCDYNDNDFLRIPPVDTDSTAEDDYYDDIVIYHVQ